MQISEVNWHQQSIIKFESLQISSGSSRKEKIPLQTQTSDENHDDSSGS